MKKNIFIIALMAVLGLALASCSKDTEGKTFVENYPIFTDATGTEVNNTTVMLALGEEYDYEYKATLAGKDVTAETEVAIYNVVTGEYDKEINTSTPGVYYVYYTGISEHEMATWTSTRTVYVYDPEVTTDISGTYNLDFDNSYYYYGGWQTITSEVARRGLTATSASITVTQLCPGIYQVSDLFAGWYTQIRGYSTYSATAYNMSGIVMLNSDNTIDCLSSKVSAWGDGLDYLQNGVYDPEKESLSWDLGYAGSIYIAPLLYKQ